MLARAQPERPIPVATHRFGSSPPPHTTGSIKGRIAKPSIVSLSHALDLQLAISTHTSLPTRLLIPPFIHGLVTDSTHPPDTVCPSAHLHLTLPLSTHWFLTLPLSTYSLLLHPSLPSRPDGRVSFSGPTLAVRSAMKQETTSQLLWKYRPAEYPPKTYWWHGGAIVQGIEKP